ncbi:spindle assembly abnormal protein 6 like protein [Ditylenchus destructor]|uniref:Spindle assembly abnormal protein 6 like protein n=1 Tax=Ditylenchus destructor TaxID=166010 RepID=A0AAD4N761_9BILA|nr:spindle assembly abnormal protein 6 like protein [Ditylenchus destructor]
MTKEEFFDEEVSVRLTNISGDGITPSSNIGSMLEKKVMLRINCTATSDIQRKEFEVEIYDEANVDFLYSGYFTSSKFSEMKQQQRVTFSIAEAPQKITSFIQQARKDSKKYVSCTIQENSNVDKCICRFELISSNDFKDTTNLSLELKKASGEKLNQEAKAANEQVETLEGNLRSLRCAYKQLMHDKEVMLHEKESMLDDMDRFVKDLDESEEKLYAMQDQLKEVSKQREAYRKCCEKLEEQMKQCEDSLANYKNQLAKYKKRLQLSEEETNQSENFLKHCKNELTTTKAEMEKHRSEKEKLAIEVEGLRTHVELLTTQLKTSEERKSLIVKNRLFKKT